MRAEAEAGHPDVRRLGKQLPGVVILQQRVHCAHALLDALQRVRGELLQPGQRPKTSSCSFDSPGTLCDHNERRGCGR